MKIKQGILLSGCAVLFASLTMLTAGSMLAAIRKVDNIPLANIIDASKVAVATLDHIGHPIRDADRKLLEKAWAEPGEQTLGLIQEIMDHYAWFDVRVNEEAWLKVEVASPDLDSRPLIQGKWTPFLIKVHNESAVDAPIGIRSRQALLPEELEKAEQGKAYQSDEYAWYRWLGLKIYPSVQPQKAVHGTKLQYLVAGIFSRDAGLRSAELEFHLEGGPVTEGHYTGKRVLFDVRRGAS